jgi:hypothetical protein
LSFAELRCTGHCDANIAAGWRAHIGNNFELLGSSCMKRMRLAIRHKRALASLSYTEWRSCLSDTASTTIEELLETQLILERGGKEILPKEHLLTDAGLDIQQNMSFSG